MRYQVPVGVVVVGLCVGVLAPSIAAPGAAEGTAEVPAQIETITGVTASVPGTTSVGVPADVTVSVHPATRTSVTIQESSTTNGWRAVDTVRTDDSGRATGSWRPLTGGDFSLRAVVRKKGKRPVSPVARTTATYGSEVPPDAMDPMTPGALSVRRSAVSRHRVGEFTVTVRGRGTPSDGGLGWARSSRRSGITITDAAGRVAFASDPGRAFVGASRNTVDWVWRSKAGAFWPQVERTERLTKQTVTSVRSSRAGVTVKGRIFGGGTSAGYTLTLTQVRRSATVTAVDLDLVVSRTDRRKKLTSVMITAGRRSGAAVHGFGESFRPFDLSGVVMPILVQEQGVTRGEEPAAKIVDLATWGAGNLNTSYAPWPSYVTAQKRSFDLADTLGSGAFSIADMSRRSQVSLESFHGSMSAQVLARSTPRSLMAARGAGSRRAELAPWIQKGAVLGIQGGTKKVRRIVKEMRQAGSKISAVWLQDWVGKRVTDFGEQLWWTWQLNRVRYPGWGKMVKDFDRQGIKTLTYINPFVVDVDRVDGQKITNFYKQGEKKGYLVRNQRGKTYVIETVGFPTALVDLTNPRARDWYADIIAKKVIGVGASGFMADFGEYLPFDSVLHKGSAREQHNRYPQLWARTVRQGCARSAVPDCLAFFRSGYLGSRSDVPLWWAGDQMVNYAPEDGMRNAVKGMLAGGVSGAPLWHSDIGGYTSVNTGVEDFQRPPNLNARWGEMQAFGPVMRTHETNRPTKNQQVYSTPTTRRQFAKSSRIYAALRSYRTGVVEEAVKQGIPAMRHAWLVYPGSKVARQDLQFFLGAHLFVAPVYDDTATTVKVTFPPGRWRHILTGQVYRGDRVTTVNAPIGTPAAFVRVGDPTGTSIITAMKKARLYRR
ncbi:MAG: alpha-glucosidase [Candidatus Nanopelagicales bacterium]